MAAAPFKAVLKLVGARTGTPLQYACTVSDVNAAFYIFPDGNNIVQLPLGENWVLIDVVLSAAGTDTTTGTIFSSGKNTGELIMNAANVATNLSRQFMSSPIGLKAGASLRITQNT